MIALALAYQNLALRKPELDGGSTAMQERALASLSGSTQPGGTGFPHGWERGLRDADVQRQPLFSRYSVKGKPASVIGAFGDLGGPFTPWS